MPEYINVPVPDFLVSEVMALVTDSLRQAGRPGGSSGETATSRDWTREQLMLLRDSDAPSVVLFCRVLDALAAVSPKPGDFRAIAENLAYEPLKLKNTFGAVTRCMRNRNELGDDPRWPVHFPGGEWAMNEHNATLWREVHQRS